MCSRLCVKNLPKTLTNDGLRKVFAEKGEVTDAKVMTKSGKSRCFGFIGYKTDKAAKAAQKYFHHTFIGTSKIDVTFANDVATQLQTARPWSKYSVGSSRHKRLNPDHELYVEERKKIEAEKKARRKKQKVLSIPEQEKARVAADGELQEFLGLMKPRSKARAWSNDEVVPEQSKSKRGTAAKAADSDSDADSSDIDSDSDSDIQEIGTDSAPSPKSVRKAPVSDLDFLKSMSKKGKPAPEDTEMSDDDDTAKLRKKKKRKNADVDGAGVDSESGHKKSKKRKKSKDDDTEDAPMGDASPSAESGGGAGGDRLFVRNIPFSATEDEIEAAFAKFGAVAEVHLPLDDLKRPKGFCFVRFESPEDASVAKQAMDGHAFQGRLIHVLAAEAQPNVAPSLGDLGDRELDSMQFKKKRELQRRANATKQDNWNALFLRQDTVAAAAAQRFGVQKRDVLDREADDSMAVKLALAETQTLEETKEFLEDNGVNARAFGGKRKGVARSKSVMLVKNLPFSTEESELRALFTQFGGSVGRVLMPPSKAVAIVEFLSPSEAKVAFRRLAYRKFKHVPLYLEWAPQDPFHKAFDPEVEKARKAALQNSSKRESHQKSKKSAENEALVEKTAAVDGDDSGDDGDDGEGGNTLFVKNLNFSTTEKQLKKVFKTVGALKSLTIKMKPNPRAKSAQLMGGDSSDSDSSDSDSDADVEGGDSSSSKKKKKKKKEIPAMLSMGYGFVEFKASVDATSALKKLQGVEIDGHKLQLKRSHAQSNRKMAKKARKRALKQAKEKLGLKSSNESELSQTKLTVKNLAFEATSREIRDLFGTYGRIKTCRLPKKFQGGHRGFAFVEFVSKQEAKNAFEALSSTHLYGRRLVLEWAKKDETVEETRARTKSQFEAGKRADKRATASLGKQHTLSAFDDGAGGFADSNL